MSQRTIRIHWNCLPGEPAVAAVLAGALALAGCASPGALERAPAVPTTLFADNANTQAAPSWPSADWWQGFKDPALDALVEHALGASPDIAAAQARTRAAAAAAASIQATALPSADLTANATRQRFTENGLVPPPYAGSWMNSGNVSARLAWSLDLFGAERARRAAALSGARAAELDARYVRGAVSAAVAELYYELAFAYDDRDLLLTRQAQGERSRAIAAGRQGAGLDDATAVHHWDAQLGALRQELLQSELRIKLTAAQLAALAGEGPQWPAVSQRPHPTPMPTNLGEPFSLNADLLGHRADVAAARERVLASVDAATAARRDYLPNLSLAALAGLDSFTLSSLFEGGSRTFSVGPALSLPLFDGGRRRASNAARRADYDAAVADYQRSVLAAVQEASSAWQRLQFNSAEQAAAAAALDAENSALRIAQQRAARGLASEAQVLQAQERQLQQQRRALQLAARQRALIVDLYRASGAGAINSGAMTPGERS